MKKYIKYPYSLTLNLIVLALSLVVSILYILLDPSFKRVPAEDFYAGPAIPYYLSYAAAYNFEFIIVFTVFISPIILYFIFRRNHASELKKVIIYNYLTSFLLIPVFILLLFVSANYNKNLRYSNNNKVVQVKNIEIRELDSNNNRKLDSIQVGFVLESDSEINAWGGTDICLMVNGKEKLCKSTYTKADIIQKGETKFTKKIDLKGLPQELAGSKIDSIRIRMTGQNVSILEYTYQLKKSILTSEYEY